MRINKIPTHQHLHPDVSPIPAFDQPPSFNRTLLIPNAIDNRPNTLIHRFHFIEPQPPACDFGIADRHVEEIHDKTVVRVRVPDEFTIGLQMGGGAAGVRGGAVEVDDGGADKGGNVGGR